MAHINLLPWREELRKQKQKEFVFMAGGAVVAAALLVLLVHMRMEGMIDTQESRNAFLEKEIAELDRRIATIRELEATRASLLARMNVIQTLQSSRPESVYLMETLVFTLPDGVHLERIEQKGRALTLRGVAESNARVSAYMRNIDRSDGMGSPKLDFIQSRQTDRRRLSEFTLQATQKSGKQGAAKDEAEES